MADPASLMRRRLPARPLLWALALLAVAALAPDAAAQRRAVSLVVENDAFASIVPWRDRSDREYTHGAWLALDRDDAPLWRGLLRGVPACRSASPDAPSCLDSRFEVGQKIFTPDIRKEDPPPNQRPYAGWLFIATTGRVIRPESARLIRVELGVTGPPSLGEDFHRLVHRLARIGMPLGWEHQLAFEPGLLLRYGERRVLESRAGSGRRLADLVLASDLSLGNVKTGAEVSATARAGRAVPHPWRAGDAEEEFRLFGILRAQQRWTARDVFLDGNTFRDGPSVERRPFTSAAELGAAVQYRDVRLTYSLVYQSRLYETQPRNHVYGSIRLSYEP